MEGHQDGQVLEYPLCEEGLRELDLGILKKRIFGGDLTAAFQGI